MEEREKVIEIEIERLRDFRKHPFQVKDDKDMHQLKESISEYGILEPLLVRPCLDSVYEVISGHRRKYAAEKLGYSCSNSANSGINPIGDRLVVRIFAQLFVVNW